MTAIWSRRKFRGRILWRTWKDMAATLRHSDSQMCRVTFTTWCFYSVWILSQRPHFCYPVSFSFSSSDPFHPQSCYIILDRFYFQLVWMLIPVLIWSSFFYWHFFSLYCIVLPIVTIPLSKRSARTFVFFKLLILFEICMKNCTLTCSDPWWIKAFLQLSIHAEYMFDFNLHFFAFSCSKTQQAH